MSMPTQPTATTIVTEALTRFYNGTAPETEEITRSIDYGLEKVKRDIMGLGKTWKPLIETIYRMGKVGVSHYDNPSDFEKDLSVGIMSGTHTGSLSNIGSSTVLTLDSTENALQREVEGKFLLITSGVGVNQAQLIDDYDTATKIVTLAAALTTLPNPLDTYLIVDRIQDLNEISIGRYDQYSYPGVPGAPVRFVALPNDTVGQIAVHPVPNAVYGIKRRYFIDLMKLDLTSTRYSTILRRWANIFEQGVYVWKLGEDDDRLATENEAYQNMLITLMAHDLYGFDAEKAGLAKSE